MYLKIKITALNIK